jgi:hypothetical protein
MKRRAFLLAPLALLLPAAAVARVQPDYLYEDAILSVAADLYVDMRGANELALARLEAVMREINIRSYR